MPGRGVIAAIQREWARRRARRKAKRAERSPKIGEGHAAAWMRQGLAELREVFHPRGNIDPPAQYGLYGTKTPGEVMIDKGVKDNRNRQVRGDPDEQPSMLESRVQEAKQAAVKRDQRSREREIGRD